MNWPAEFNLAQDHCSDVLFGCYDLPVEPKTVLDIGANVGAFARWASGRWPTAQIHSYEPQPDNFALLARTITHFSLPNVTPHPVAVSDKASTMTLHENGYNCGEWSLIKFDPRGKGQVEVPVMDAAELPDAEFIKIDTEGMEPNILKRLADTGKLLKANAVVLEYHAAPHIAPIIYICQQAGLHLHHVAPHMEHRGVLKFVRA